MADNTFDDIQKKWKAFIIGSDLDLEDSYVLNYVERLNSEANEHWESLIKSDVDNRDALWQDLKIKKYKVQNGKKIEYQAGRLAFDQVWYCFIRINAIAKATMTKGCELYQNEYAIEELLKALDILCEDYYSVNAEPYGNWWNWEIGIPQSFLSAIMVLRNYISSERLANYLAPLNKFVASCEYSTVMQSHPKMTGANLLDKATSQAMIGVLENNGDKINDVLKAVKTVFVYANNRNKKITQQNDGFWRDGSYIQHSGIAYNGGYGAALYAQVGIFLSIFKNTKWEFSYSDKCENIVFDSLFIGVEPLMYNGRFMDMTSGRGISRESTNDKNRCVSILVSIIPYVDSMPNDEMKNRLKSLIKYHIACDEKYFYDNCKNIYSLVKAKEIMSDNSVEAIVNSNYNKCFASMDKTVHTRPDYSYAVSMHSNRLYCHEIFNKEGKSTWNISDGMTYLYDSDFNQYGDGFWGSVDMRRLPGITSEYVLRKEGAGHFKKNPYKFVGMTNIDSFGVTAMHLKTLGNGSFKNGTSAKKSWFMFDDEIVCLGSNITSFTGNYVESVIDNRKIDENAKDEIIIDGKVRSDLLVDKNNKEPKGKTINNVSYIHLSGENGSQIGYTFPQKTSVKALKEIRKTNWLTIGNSDKDITRGYATFLFDHGKMPINKSYAYCVHPNFTDEKTKEYSQNQQYSILCQNAKAHIVKHNKLNITGACLWKKTSDFINGFKSNKGVVAMVRDKDSVLSLAVADPTQSEDEIVFSYDDVAKGVVSKDENIEVIALSPITIKINTNASYGKTYNIEFKK